MNIVIFGANGRTGRILTKLAVSEGHTVTAVTRHPDIFPVRGQCLTVYRGDVLDPASVDVVIAGKDAVLSVLGVPYSRKPITLYSTGMTNIVEAMRRHSVRRLVGVSSTAVDPRYDTQGGIFFERVLKPMIAGTIGRTTYADQRRMEALVQSSGLDWTIVRPSGLFETPDVTDYQVTDGYRIGRFTSRTDLAAFMLQVLREGRYSRRFAAVATVAVQPTLLQLLLKEAFPRQPSVLTPKV
jgi:putative NADH-flavin reductase